MGFFSRKKPNPRSLMGIYPDQPWFIYDPIYFLIFVWFFFQVLATLFIVTKISFNFFVFSQKLTLPDHCAEPAELPCDVEAIIDCNQVVG